MTQVHRASGGWRCACFFRDNYFSALLGVHFRFVDGASFVRDNEASLSKLGVDLTNSIPDGVHVDAVVAELETEARRRRDLGRVILDRKAKIRDGYVPIEPDVYRLNPKNHLSPDFVRLVTLCRERKTTSGLRAEIFEMVRAERAEGVCSFEVFTPDFCRSLVKELEHFESSLLPKGRPNTMNRYGVLLDELLDFETGFVDVLRRDYLQPVAEVLIPGFSGVTLDSQKPFVVKYGAGEDIDLAYHYDNAEVTLNVCLGKDFEDGQLYFGDLKTFENDDQQGNQPRFVPVDHVVGRGILHRGLHRHGAMPITSGTRLNLILWFRASSIRQRLCPMCGQRPDLVAVDGGHDGFLAAANTVG